MTTQPTDPAPVTDPTVDPAPTDPPKPSETVDYWKQKSRENESRAKSNADAAKELTAIKDAQKSEAEKVTDKLNAADAAVASVPTKVSEALRAHLVALHDINDEDAELFLTATDPQVLLKQVDRLIARGTEQSTQRKKNANHVPGEGANPQPAGDDMREFTRNLFANAAGE